MSLDYALKLRTRTEPAKVLEAARSALEAAGGTRTDPAVLVGIAPATPIGRDVIREALGFEPDLSVLFKVASRTEPREAAVRAVLAASLRLLEAEGGDAALLFNGETVVFVRRSGAFTLDEGFWTPARAPLAPRGAARARFPVI